MASGIAIKKMLPQKNKLGGAQYSHSSCSELFLGRLLPSRAYLRFTLSHKDNNPVYFLTGKLSTSFLGFRGNLSTYIMRAHNSQKPETGSQRPEARDQKPETRSQ